jgi:uncharacterized membrane protein YkoI
MRKILTTLALAALLGPTGARALAAQDATVPEAKARAAALAGVANQQGVLSEKLKTAHGVLVYEYDIDTPGAGHQEVRVDAHTGVVVMSRHEDDVAGKVWSSVSESADKAAAATKHAAHETKDAAKDVAHETKDAAKDVAHRAQREADRVFTDEEARRLNPAISETRARQIAQARVPGAPVKDVDLETENGVLVWQVDLDTEGSGHEEVLVDALTGKVLRVEHEH